MAIFTMAVTFILEYMLNYTTSCLIFAVSYLVSRYLYLKLISSRLPPGPYGLPLFGYTSYITVPIHKLFDNLSKTYGSIFSVSFGTTTIVVLNDPQLIRSCLSREEFSDRPENSVYDIVNRYGVTNVNGPKWKQQRKFVHERLRNLGMKTFGPGREHMEHKIMNEVEHLVQSIAVHKGKPMDVMPDFKTAAGNVLYSMLMSVRFEKEDPTLQRFMELYYEGFKLFVVADSCAQVPLMKYSSTSRQAMEKLKANHSESMEIINKILEERRKCFNPSESKGEDLLDAYLHEEYVGKMNGTLKNLEDLKNHTNQILQVMNDLFSAGQETVGSALQWALVHLLHNPEVLKKIQDDLDETIGRGRLPCLNDLANLPYVEATIFEILRISVIFPIGPPHSVVRDTYVNNYFLPKGTLVFPNLYTCLRSEKYWTNPDKFDPTRFLNKEGKVVKPAEYMPFSVGRRVCLGEIIARSEIFLFLSSILHVFNLEKSPHEELPSTEGETQISHLPRPFKVCFVPREISVLPVKESVALGA